MRLYDELDEWMGDDVYRPFVPRAEEFSATRSGSYIMLECGIHLRLYPDGGIEFAIYPPQWAAEESMRAVARYLGKADIALFYVAVEARWYVTYDGLKPMSVLRGMVILPRGQLRDD